MAEEVATPAVEAASPEDLIKGAIADLKTFCDGMRADFQGLSSRMDSMEAPKPAAVADAASEEVPAVATPPEVPPIDKAPPATEPEDTPAGAAEDAAMAAATPTELAADALPDMEALADSAAARHTAGLRADIARLSKLVPAELTIEQRQAFASAQEQAEQAFQSFGDHAPAPMQGEAIGTYKRRLASKMQPYGDKWKGTKLTAISDDNMLDVVVGEIYNDAISAARRGADVEDGHLMPVTTRTEAGHTIRTYRGTPGAWMRPLAGATRRATGKFNTGR